MERVAFSITDASNFGKEKMLRPLSAEARAVMQRLDVGEDVAVEIYRERSNKFSSKVHLVFQAIAEAKGMRVRNVRGWVAAMTGRADVITIDGDAVMVAWGTGARDMSAEEFELFWEDARDVIIKRILPTLEKHDAEAIARMMD